MNINVEKVNAVAFEITNGSPLAKAPSPQLLTRLTAPKEQITLEDLEQKL
jgi:hypothetical protein